MDENSNNTVQDKYIIANFSERDFEKLVLGLLLVLTVLAALYVYIIKFIVDFNIIYLIGILSTSFVARKGLSYFKPDRYYVNSSGSDELDKSQTKDSELDSKKKENEE